MKRSVRDWLRKHPFFTNCLGTLSLLFTQLVSLAFITGAADQVGKGPPILAITMVLFVVILAVITAGLFDVCDADDTRGQEW